MAISCKIEVLSHGLVVTDISQYAKPVIFNYARQFISYKRERPAPRAPIQVVPDRVYSWANALRTEIRFHRNQLDDLLSFLNRHGISEPLIVHRDIKEPVKVDVKLPETWIPRENQVPIIDYVVDDGAIKTVTLQTGQGKTSCSLKAAERIGNRIMITVLGRFFSKWVGDIKKQYSLKAGELVTIRGTSQLEGFLKMAHDGELDKCKVIIITVGTLINYIDGYASEEWASVVKQKPWVVPPDKLYEVAGIGLRITDEVHMHSFQNYIIDLHTHIKKALYLSATLDGDDPLSKAMAKIAFPMKTRINGGAFIKISNVTCYTYEFTNMSGIRFSGFGGAYNHNKFEETLFKNKNKAKAYMQMVADLIKERHLTQAKPGQKCLIFAARVDTCIALVKYLTPLFPNLTISKYTSEDDDTVIYNSDITVTTLGSAGTALDIDGLLTCIMTTAINSRQMNEQALGRLRALRDCPDQTPLFIYLACLQIPKHLEYHKKKIDDIFKGKVLKYSTLSYGKAL